MSLWRIEVVLLGLLVPLFCKGKVSNYDYSLHNKISSLSNWEKNVDQIVKDENITINEMKSMMTKPEVIGFRTNSYELNLSKNIEHSSPALAYTLFLCLIPLATVIGNVLIIVAVLRFRTLHTAINFLILGLAVADLLVALFVMPFAVYVYMHDGNWLLGSRMCDMYTAGDVACSTASILLLAVISFDRYRAVSSPIEYSRQSKNIKRVLLILLAIWIISFSLASPIVLGVNEPPPDASQNECRLYSASFSISSSIISFVIPCFIVLFVYIRIMVALRKRQKAAKMRRAANGGCGIKNDTRSFRLRSFKNQINDPSKDEAGRIISAPAVSMMMMALPSMSKRMQKMEKSNKIVESTITEDDYEEDDNNSLESDESTYESCIDVKKVEHIKLPMVSNLTKVFDDNKSYNLLFSSIGLSNNIKIGKDEILRRKSFTFKGANNSMKHTAGVRRHSNGNISFNPIHSTSTHALCAKKPFLSSKSSFINKSVPQVLSNIHSLLRATSIQSLIHSSSSKQKLASSPISSSRKLSYALLSGSAISPFQGNVFNSSMYRQRPSITLKNDLSKEKNYISQPVIKFFDYEKNISSDIIDNPIELACETLNIKECENQSVPLNSDNPLYTFPDDNNLSRELGQYTVNRFADTSKSTTSIKSTDFDESMSLTKNSISSDYTESLSNVEIEKPKSEKKSNFFANTARRYTLAKIPGKELTQHGDKLLKNVINKFHLKKHSHSIDVPNLLEQVNLAKQKTSTNDTIFETYKNYNFIPAKESPLLQSKKSNNSSNYLELDNIIKNEYLTNDDSSSENRGTSQDEIIPCHVSSISYSTAPLAKSEFEIYDEISERSSFKSFDNCPSGHTILYGLETLNDPALSSLHEFDNIHEVDKDEYIEGMIIKNEQILEDDGYTNISNESTTESQSFPSNAVTFKLSIEKPLKELETKKLTSIAKQVSLPIQPSLVIHSPDDIENEIKHKNPKLTISSSNIEIGYSETFTAEEINTKSSYESDAKLSVASKMLEIKNKFFSHSEDNFQRILNKKSGQKSVKRKESSMKRKANKVQRKEKRATKTLGIVVGTFLICWVPFFSLNVINGICTLIEAESCQVGFNPFFYTTWIGYMNSFMNPIIYSIFNTEFRRAFKSILTGNNNGNRNRWVLTRTS